MADRPDCESRFNGIYEQFARKVYAYFATGFGPDMAEDLTQQTFVQVWRFLDLHPDWAPDSWQAWIYGVARNVRNDHLRARHHQPESLSYDDAIADCGSDTTNDWEDRLAVRTAFGRLPPQDQELLMYKTVGLDSGEVGSILGLSASAVRSRMQQARNRFRDRLSECGVETDA